MSEVQFRVDGQNIGPPDTSSPFSIQWATSDVSNGSHTLTAVARDTPGNATTSPPVTVTVFNRPPPTTPPPLPEPQPKQIPPAGNPAPAGAAPVAPADLAPAISRLKLSRSTFRAGTATKISFRLSEASQVKLSFERKLSGHRARGRCVRPPLKGRSKCVLYARVRTTITLQGKAGANSLTFRGKLSRTRRLAPGRYRLTLLATDATGKRSVAAHTSFRLLESRARAVRTAVLSWF